MGLHSRPVHPALRGLVARLDGYDETMPADACHLGVPGGTATVIVALGEPLDVGWNLSERHRFGITVAGLHLSPAFIRTHGRQCGIQLELTPAGTRRLLGVPIGALCGTVAEAGSVTSGPLARMRDRVDPATPWSHRLDVAEQVLLAELRHDRAMPELAAAAAWRLLTPVPDRAGASVSEVADALGYSRRRLQDLVRAEFGLSPKRLQRLRRFAAARTHALSGRGLTETAGRFGYADQAHLTREWTAFAGRPPMTDLGNPYFVPEPDSARER